MTIIIREVALSPVVMMMVMIPADIVAADHTARVDEPIHALWWLSEELILTHQARSKAPTTTAHANIRSVICIAQHVLRGFNLLAKVIQGRWLSKGQIVWLCALLMGQMVVVILHEVQVCRIKFRKIHSRQAWHLKRRARHSAYKNYE